MKKKKNLRRPADYLGAWATEMFGEDRVADVKATRLSPKQLRRLSAWCLKAADWIEDGRKSK